MSRNRFPAAAGFLLPNFLGLVFFIIFPVALSLWMAFTNWSLKPAVGLEFVGLRNFQDLLGVRAINHGRLPVALGYVLASLAALAAIVVGLWANFGNWRGLKLSGLLFATAAAALLAAVFIRAFGAGRSWGQWVPVEAGAGSFLAALFIGAAGIILMRREDATWRFGAGIIPGLLLVGGIAGQAALDSAMWSTYELRDPRFWQYLYNTLFLMSAIPVGIGGALALAMLLNDPFPVHSRRRQWAMAGVLAGVGLCICAALYGASLGLEQSAGLERTAVLLRNGAMLFLVLCGVSALGVAFNVVAFRTLFYLPTFTAGVALMILWKALYNHESGPINALIGGAVGYLEPLARSAGFHGLAGWLLEHAKPMWLGDTRLAKPALMVMGLWIGMGGTTMLLYLAALSNVPRDLLDAAEVDGAGRWGRFRHVIWPSLAPTTFFISVMSVIGGLQGGFEQARVMTGGGPEGSTTTLSFYIYNKAFQDLDLGYAAAIAWILFAFIFLATALNWKFGRGMEVDL